MPGRASIVGAAETSVGKVREHNEDSHFIDPENGIFIVCDGMGGHAAGEVASQLAVKTIRRHWTDDATQAIADRWLLKGTPEARRQLLAAVQQGVIAAHDAIVEEAQIDRTKHGMGTTVIAALVVGGDVVFAQCGDSRAYLVRDGIAMQLTEDHTLLARLLAAGVDVDVDGDGSRFKSMLTNALGIGHECKVTTFVVPVADGDRFLLCSDGITEYLQENEIGEVLTTMPSPARSAQRLVEIALDRGGGDNATALVARVLEAGERARPSDQLKKDEKAIHSCSLWAKLSPQQRLRALRIALPRDHAAGDKVPANTLGDRVSWIVIEGELEQDAFVLGPGALVYPEALLADSPLPDKDGLAVAKTDVRALALRADDFRELCEDDTEIAEHLLGALAVEVARRRPQRVNGPADGRGVTDPGLAHADTGQFAALTPPGSVDSAVPEIVDDEDEAQGPTTPPPKSMSSDAFARTLPPTKSPIDPLATTLPPPPPEPAKAEAGTSDAATADAAKAEAPPRRRQPSGSTVPPHTAPKRASTDRGGIASDRSPAADGNGHDLGRAPTAQLRASSPPLISAPAETEAAVDEAWGGLEGRGEDVPSPDSTAPAHGDEDEPEISIEAAADDDAPVSAQADDAEELSADELQEVADTPSGPVIALATARPPKRSTTDSPE